MIARCGNCDSLAKLDKDAVRVQLVQLHTPSWVAVQNQLEVAGWHVIAYCVCLAAGYLQVWERLTCSLLIGLNNLVISKHYVTYTVVHL